MIAHYFMIYFAEMFFWKCGTDIILRQQILSKLEIVGTNETLEVTVAL